MRMTRWLALVLATVLLTLPVAADEMQDAMDRADALNLFRQINLQPAQARQMVGPLESIQETVEAYNRGRVERLNQLNPSLKRARQQLIAGQEISEEMVQALQTYQEQREAAQRRLYQTVAAQMDAVAGVLAPEQNRYLDWTAPASVRPQEALQERLEVQRTAMGRIQEAAQMIDEVKHLDAFNYVTGRTLMINDYLALYFEPGTRQFQQAFEVALDYTGEARMLTEEQWQAQALDFGAGLVQDVGLMPMMSDQRPGAVSWNTLFRIMTNAETLTVVRGMAR